jgi:hypothetical protein
MEGFEIANEVLEAIIGGIIVEEEPIKKQIERLLRDEEGEEVKQHEEKRLISDEEEKAEVE